MSSLASQIASGSLSLPTLASLHASGLVICSNVRLHHRYPNAAAVQKWMSSVAVRITPAGQPESSHRGVEGDLVVGLLYPPMAGAAATRIRDHTGALHYIEPRTSDPATHAPLRVLAVLGTRDSSTHVCGAVFDPAAAAAATSPSASALAFTSMPLSSGLKLAWLAEEGGLVGHLTSDASPSIVLGVRSEADPHPKVTGAGNGAPAFEVLQQACAFEVVGPLVELDGRKAINIRSLCPIIPPTPSLTPSAAHAHGPVPTAPASLLASSGTTPRVILVGSTASTLGKTTLCSLIVQSLHALSFSRGLEAPRIAFVKLTGSGGSRDVAQMMQIKNARGQRAVCAAFDHVDAGLATTYTPAPQAGPQALSTQQERFKQAIADLIALASQPCAVPSVGGAMPSRRTPSSGSSSAHSPASATGAAASKALPPDYLVVELGSDLIFASNPVVLAASAHCIRDRLLGLLLLAENTLAILGALSWLHGNLRFPPELLHIVVDPRRNRGGMAKRISGSEIELHAMQAADIQALMQQIVPAPSPAEVAASAAAASELSLPAPSLTAASLSAVASAVPSVVHTTALPSRGASSSPRPPSQTAAAAVASSSDGSTSAASSAATPSWPSHATAAQSSATDPVSSPRTMLAADAEALAWFERSFAPWVASFPPLVAPSSDAALSPATSMMCLALVEWSTQCTPKLGALGSLQWQAAEVCLLLLRLSRSDRLAHSLAYLAALRRRDKIRKRLAKEKEEAARDLLGASLGKLMAAKTGGTPVAAAATPSAAAPSPDASAAAAAATSLLLSLPDLSHTPYSWLPPSVPPPASAPAALLDFDAGLGVLRLATVPARVSEQPFWDCYFGCMAEELSAYLTSKSTAGQ